MNSIKELKEQLGYEEIGLDDIFVFHCTQCGKCCIHREDILLSPKDLFHIAKKLKITPEEKLPWHNIVKLILDVILISL